MKQNEDDWYRVHLKHLRGLTAGESFISAGALKNKGSLLKIADLIVIHFKTAYYIWQYSL